MRRILVLLPLLLLLLWPRSSIQGASAGLLLWFQVILPTLSPFIICTQAVIALDGVELLMKPFAPTLGRLFRLSKNGTYVLLCGLLCGYPLGARLCGEFQQRKALPKGEAPYLFAICNHPSPMFLLGYVSSQLPFSLPVWVLPFCLYAPVLPLSMAARRYYLHTGDTQIPLRPQSLSGSGSQTCQHSAAPSLEEILFSTCDTMVLIGGTIMLFSILIAWLQKLSFLSAPWQALFAGLLEITTGIRQLCIVLPPELLLPAVTGVVAFGGLSGIFQTRSVTKNAGLSIRHYLVWKTLHGGLSCLCIIALQAFLPLLPR